MSNIVPKNPESGQLGRLNRRWAELHTKLASVSSIKISGTVDSPEANELHINDQGALQLGANSVALQGDLDSLRALLDAFLSESGDDGVGSIVASFGTTYDTLRELIDGLETLTSYALTTYVDDEISTLSTSLTGTITALSGRVSTNETDISNLQTSVSSLSLDSLTDVSLGTLSSGQVLKYNGTAWSASDDDNTQLTTSGTLDSIQI